MLDGSVGKWKGLFLSLWSYSLLPFGLFIIFPLVLLSSRLQTALVKVLSKELDFEIVEWTNPIDSNVFHEENSSQYDKGITEKFLEFLSTCSASPSLVFSNREADTITPAVKASSRGKIILVEDIPNMSNYSTRLAIQNAISSYALSSGPQNPIVFIMSHVSALNSSGSHSVPSFRNLIPIHLRNSDRVLHISFNPIAPVLLRNALVRISGMFGGAARGLTTDDCEEIALNSGGERLLCLSQLVPGDIRLAINALQFHIEDSSTSIVPTDTQRGTSKSRRKRGAPSKARVGGRIVVGRREQDLVLFHAIGKILSGKRANSNESGTAASLFF